MKPRTKPAHKTTTEPETDGGPLVTHVAVRLDDATLAKVDALLPTMSTAWHTPTRSDAVRYAIVEGLAAIAAKSGKTKKGGT